MVHGRSVRQVLRLFKRLYNPDDYIYIHVDARSQYMYDILKPLDNGSNVIVTDRRFTPIWGGVTLMTMMLNAMKEMLEFNWNFDFFIDLSGADYLLKKPAVMKEYLRHKVGMNFVYIEPKESLLSRMTSKELIPLVLLCFVSFRFVSFRFVSFRFVSFRFV